MIILDLNLSRDFVNNFDPISWSKFLKTFNMCRIILKYSYFLYNVNDNFYCNIIPTFLNFVNKHVLKINNEGIVNISNVLRYFDMNILIEHVTYWQVCIIHVHKYLSRGNQEHFLDNEYRY